METTNILVTGSNGQLGKEIQVAFENRQGYKLYCTDINELDITDSKAVDNYIKNNTINIVINCAAYTAVDAAEDNAQLCKKLNVEAIANIAQSAEANNAKVIHISTDYVFDGCNFKPYTEEDTPAPKSVYGTTKLEGEKRLLSIAPDSIIIRTSWLYSPHGKNFVKTMIRLGEEKDSINVVCDQIGTPTSATDLANAIYTIIDSNKIGKGIYHFSNEGAISWYDFAKAIHRLCGIKNCNINPIPSRLYPTPAQRPYYSVLDKSKIKDTFHIVIPYWESSLEKCINNLKINS
ncbi:MAG: dTDP-4-dehydrorhamnose reductase [Muribaculaceae bacterium]|nr:dTDP-4-dehydrorhamnose reductase [Muribaculaceae bacterium]